MKDFKNFEIQNQEMIIGGEHRRTRYTDDSGSGGEDIYDTEVKKLVYFPYD